MEIEGKLTIVYFLDTLRAFDILKDAFEEELLYKNLVQYYERKSRTVL